MFSNLDNIRTGIYSVRSNLAGVATPCTNRKQSRLEYADGHATMLSVNRFVELR